MKTSAIDRAIEALEAKKDAHDRVIEMAIQELIAQRATPKAPRAPRGTRKNAKSKKEETSL